MIIRGITATQLLQKAQALTGKAYKRGEYEIAAADVSALVQEMKAALPQREACS